VRTGTFVGGICFFDSCVRSTVHSEMVYDKVEHLMLTSTVYHFKQSARRAAKRRSSIRSHENAVKVLGWTLALLVILSPSSSAGILLGGSTARRMVLGTVGRNNQLRFTVCKTSGVLGMGCHNVAPRFGGAVSLFREQSGWSGYSGAWDSIVRQAIGLSQVCLSAVAGAAILPWCMRGHKNTTPRSLAAAPDPQTIGPDCHLTAQSYDLLVHAGSARRARDGWTVPVEAQLLQDNSGRHAVLVTWVRRLVFKLLFRICTDRKARHRYESRARLLLQSFLLPDPSVQANRQLLVRIVDSAGSGKWQRLALTDMSGHAKAKLHVQDEEIPQSSEASGRMTIEVMVEGEPRALPAKASLPLVPPHGLTVISDIDDTVKITEVFRGTKALLHNTFFKKLEAVPGMARLYSKLAKEHHASFEYVSKSPPEFHRLLHDFLVASNFPEALSLHLCPLLHRERSAFKMRQTKRILGEFPNRHFVLVGDSGERDPEIYAELLRQHPKQIVKILIRRVHPRFDVPADTFHGIDPSKWQVFSDPMDIDLRSIRVPTQREELACQRSKAHQRFMASSKIIKSSKVFSALSCKTLNSL